MIIQDIPVDFTEDDLIYNDQLTNKGATMKTTNINKTAMALARQLLKINNVMTTKVKGFNYFLIIAYKMLKNEAHFLHVLTGLHAIKNTMIDASSVTPARFKQFIDSYSAIYLTAPFNVMCAVY